ncbi:MAG TPA: ABC transporter permease [Saprospiraceae bacterium]|nr:ABC transporter permease [Saprospiraceae bacterium]
MITTFKMAWRNIWRNKRRTYITATSILLAVLLSAFMVSIQRGAWDKMIDNVVNFYYGYVQIHNKGYWEDQNINKAFTIKDDLIETSKKIPAIHSLVPRLESFALAAHQNFSRGVLVVGTDPDKENEMTHLKERLIKGTYFDADEQAIIIAEGIANKMKITIGDTLVLISQGYHGVNAAGKYPIKAIVKFGSPELNKQMVYLPLKTAQYFFGAENLVTSVALNIKNRNRVQSVVDKLKTSLDTSTYEVMEWQELMPELVQAREVDTAGNYITLFVLYVIIAFGIFGTILMMTKEREYEFGVLIAIGMNRLKLFITVWMEIIFLGLLGALLGILVSFPLIYYFNINPLDFTEMSAEMSAAYEKFGFEPVFPTALDWRIFKNQALLVFAITSILAIYPLAKIMKINPVKAMRQ